MSSRQLLVTAALWRTTWDGLHERGGGERETACVWLGSREDAVETAQEVVFLDDLPGTVGRRLRHKTSRQAVAEMLARARQLGLGIVADIHTHPEGWVGLSPVDQEHPIEYRIGFLALVLPNFAAGAPDLGATGVHEYLGSGRWQTFAPGAARRRVRIQEGRHP